MMKLRLILFFIIVLVVTGSNIVQPLLIGQIPIDRFAEPFFKCYGRRPSQLFINLCGIYGVAPVVARPVLYICNQLFGSAWRTPQFFVHFLAQQLYQRYILPFVEAADIIGLSVPAIMK